MTTAAATTPTRRGSRALRRFLRHPGGMLGALLLVLLIGVAAFAPQVVRHPPLKVNPVDRLKPPSAAHWMGTDELGRDVFARVVYGARISLRLGLVSVAIALSFGLTIGIVAGFFGGRIDALLMRIVDVLLAFPSLILALIAVFALGPGLFNAMIAVGIASIPAYARVTRAEVLSAKENLYVQAAQALGSTRLNVMLRHVLPNVVAPNIVLAALGTGAAILAGAALSFLGLGAQAPAPEWGLMLSKGKDFMLQGKWWLTVFPGLGIMVTVMAMNLFGDGLRDVLDPRLR